MVHVKGCRRGITGGGGHPGSKTKGLATSTRAVLVA